ncbi:hypothetical protein KAW64_10835 [bacterium]|nr:hypothetical protein [bacterium]
MFRTCMIVLMVLCLCVPAAAKDTPHVKKPGTAVIHEFSVPEESGSRIVAETCELGISYASWLIDDWLVGEEEYSFYADPGECSYCAGGWQPFNVGMLLNFGLGDSLHFIFEVVLREVDPAFPGCPTPGAIIYGPILFEITLPEVGAYIISAGLPDDAPVFTEPFFASWGFPNAFAEGARPDVFTGDEPCTDCYSYNYWGSTWSDNCAYYGFPGDISMFVRVECQPLEAALDIKPTSCPNPLNVKSRGVLPTAILGTEDFDVTQIDPGSIMLAGVVPPLRWSWSDVATPIGPDPELCECNELGGDGFLDLAVKFVTQEVVAAIAPFDDGDYVSVEVTAELLDGTAIVLHDCVWIRDKTREGTRTALEAPDNEGFELKASAEEKTWGTIKALYR